jgi:hypothetical protein
MLIGRTFLILSVHVIILALTVIGKEYHDNRLAQLGRQQHHADNVTIRYGTGSGDSEKGVGAEK